MTPAIVRFEIPGDPVAWARARVNRQGARFTPKAQALYADQIRLAWERAEAEPFERGVPLEMRVVCHFPRPKSHYGTGRNTSRLKPNAPAYKTGRPDGDNLWKICADSLIGLAFQDDALIVRGQFVKLYANPDERRETAVTIRSLEAA